MTEMLVRIHRHEKALATILPGTWIPVARTTDGRLVAVLTADSIHWTAPLAEATREFARGFAGQQFRSREMFVSGESSALFRNSLASLGWAIVDHCESRWAEPDVPESAAAAQR
jgi:hypothetical protein